MTNFSINGTMVSTLGFKVKGIEGHLDIGEPKPQLAAKDDFTSENYLQGEYYQQGFDITVKLFGKYASIAAAITALYTLYGMLVQVGEHTFIHTDGSSHVTFMGNMHKGAKVTHAFIGGGLFFDVELNIQKTND